MSSDTEKVSAPGSESSLDRPFRVLVVSGGYQVFGKERVVLELLRGLKERGYEVHCLTNAWNNGQFIRHLSDLRVPYTAVFLGWFYLRKPWWTLNTLAHAPRAWLECVRLYRRFKPDVVIHDSYRSVAHLGWMLRRRNILSIHDYCSKRSEQLLLRLIDRRVAVYVPCSRDVGQGWVAAGLAKEKFQVVLNPVRFDLAMSRDRCSAEKSLSVGIVGQITHRKGHHVAIEALAYVRDRSPDLIFRLKVFGQGPVEQVARLKALAENRRVDDMIDWCGYREDLNEIYSQIDFSLVPSITPDPAPLAAIEPAIFRKPVIASKIGGLPEIVRDGITGFLVSPGDVAALADRIVQLLHDSQLISSMGDAAYLDCKSRFDAAIFFNSYQAIIQNVIGHTSKARSPSLL